MEVLDTTIANVAVPVIAGDLGASDYSGYLGHYIICCGECDFSTANRIYGKTVWRSKTVYRLRSGICFAVVVVRHCTQSSGFGDLQGVTRLCSRTVDSAVAKFVNGIVSS